MPPYIQCGLFFDLELSEQFVLMPHQWTVYVTAVCVRNMEFVDQQFSVTACEIFWCLLCNRVSL
jgi:hypothetical protein